MIRTRSSLPAFPSATSGLRDITARGSTAASFLWNFFASNREADAHESYPTDVRRRTPKMARLEAVLFVADEPLPIKRLIQLATLADADEAQELIDRLNLAYDASGSTFRVERVATGLRLLTRREFVYWLDKLHQRQAALKLTPPMLETLAIVAYRQPLTRADVEAVRGVQSAEMLKQLMERELIRIAGEDDSLGRPFLYETTRKFLEAYGVQSLDDLPMADRLRRKRAVVAEEITSAA
ncbi:MAG: segregation and condensation protein B [Planctomycetota bacterium]|nr:MAG: segregation and condensation protein B [Planctomycetota bacterium]